ncbi:unnamed protein product [Heterobilharzia americana]|nr:unnamed protein product [Heterobilharzia americana]CAH8582739.1 unnamed protein product [Heterobilharzia americana]
MWMQRPAIVNCPPGLEYLTQVDQLLVKQSKEILETLLSFETQNRYTCFNVLGQPVYRCFEESGFCTRAFCGSSRPFFLHIIDGNNSEVIRAGRPFRCNCFPCCSCCDCCLDVMEVESPVGNIIGCVKQVPSGCYRNYHILDSNHSTVLQIRGPPYCLCNCIGQDINFKVSFSDSNVCV